MTTPPAVTAMMLDEAAPTAPLLQFRVAFEEDPNWWWRISSGHHLNLFEAALERIEELEAQLVLELNKDTT